MKKYLVVIFLFVLILILFSLRENNKDNLIYDNISIIPFFCPEDNCKEAIIFLINNSKEIKCAFYELNDPDIINELKKKNSEIIIEDSTYEKNSDLYFYNNEIKNKLIKTNSSFLTFYSKALMHNKFCIFDKKIVLTGSMNPTFNDNYLNNNNILIIKSDKLSEIYLDEFNELKNNIYGKGKKSKYNLIYDNNKNQTSKIKAFFCPEDNCQKQVLKEIENANYSIYFMTFSFTDFSIANKLIELYNIKNITIKGIYDKSQISNYSTYFLLKNFSIIDKNNYKMHNKVFIIDNKTIISGSYNPTKNANFYNDENLIIIENKEIAEKYIKKFFEIYNLKSIEEQILELRNITNTFIDFNKLNSPYIKKDLLIKNVEPNPEGKDYKNEFIVIYNPFNKSIDFNHYKISNGKLIKKINYTEILNNTYFKIYPSFSLNNKKGEIYLIKNNFIIDFYIWGYS